MSEKQYPYTGWVLTPSYEPKEETFLRIPRLSLGPYDAPAKRKLYDIREVYGTKSEAIAAGNAKLNEHREKLKQMKERIDKRQAALDKAATE